MHGDLRLKLGLTPHPSHIQSTCIEMALFKSQVLLNQLDTIVDMAMTCILVCTTYIAANRIYLITLFLRLFLSPCTNDTAIHGRTCLQWAGIS